MSANQDSDQPHAGRDDGRYHRPDEPLPGSTPYKTWPVFPGRVGLVHCSYVAGTTTDFPEGHARQQTPETGLSHCETADEHYVARNLESEASS